MCNWYSSMDYKYGLQVPWIMVGLKCEEKAAVRVCG